PPHATLADPILERNPFDSTTGPLDRTDRDYSTHLPESVCKDITLRRLVLSDTPDWSFAELSSGADTALLHLGGSFHGRRLTEIAVGRVWLENARGTCEAYLPSPAPVKVSSSACIASHFKLGPPCISARTETSFDIAAAMVDHVLEEQSELMR